MSEWQPIETAPKAPMDVLFWSATTEWTDAHGNLVDVPNRERYETGYWDGHEFFETGTNHAVFEFPGDEENIHKPTHWMPLPAPPAETA